VRILENSDEHSLVQTLAVAAENLADALPDGTRASRVVIISREGLDGALDEIESLVAR
jgi:hypothetical protein